MTRIAVAIDRLIVALAGLVLVAGGAGALWWTFGPRAADALTLGPVAVAAGQPWWPWVGGAVGLVLIASALRWLATHRRAARAGTVRIAQGMTADVTSMADAAAAALEVRPGVVSARARAVTERGVPTITLTATVAARSGLAAAAAAADEVAGTVTDMLPGGVAVRTRVRVDAQRRRVVR